MVQSLTRAVPHFLGLPVSDQIGFLLDPDAVRWCDRAHDSSVIVASGMLDRRPVVIAATDPSHAAGSIGSADAFRLIAAFVRAKAQRSTLVLLLDSAGARLTDGVAVLGAFRRLQRVMLETEDAGIRVVAVLGRHCFGGASLLAFGALARLYIAGGQFGLSGPKAVLALDPAAKPADVLALYANERRVLTDRCGTLSVDDAGTVRTALARCLDQPALKCPPEAVDAAGFDMQGERVDACTFAMWFPKGCELHASGHMVEGTAPVTGTIHRIAGLVDGAPVTPAACQRMTALLVAIALEPGVVPMILLLDSPGQSAASRDEAEPFSMLLAQLGAALFRLRFGGRRVQLWITGQAGGAVYVALAAAADTVVAWPGACIGTLPRAAIVGVLGGRDVAAHPDLVATGVIDRRAGRLASA